MSSYPIPIQAYAIMYTVKPVYMNTRVPYSYRSSSSSSSSSFITSADNVQPRTLVFPIGTKDAEK